MKHLYYFFAIAILFSACKGEGGTPDNETKESAGPVEKQKAVCIYDEVAVRAVPEKKGKYLTSLSLGETMSYLGEEKADSTDKKQNFYKVELSDGTVAWARTYGVIVDGQPATVTDQTAIYKRPDLVNKTDKTFNPMEFVVIIGEKSDWVEVVGVKKSKSGWIKKQYLTTKDEDVAVSTLAYKSILKNSGELIPEEVPAFLESLPFKNSGFNSYLQKIVDEQVGAAIEESIKESAEELEAEEIVEAEGVVEAEEE